MMKIRIVILFLLVAALLIQNTCPFNAAGKSSVIATCKTCSLKHSFIAADKDRKVLLQDASSVHYPVYVFSVPKTVHTFRLDPIQSLRPVLADQYQDALPDELLRPPRA